MLVLHTVRSLLPRPTSIGTLVQRPLTTLLQWNGTETGQARSVQIPTSVRTVVTRGETNLSGSESLRCSSTLPVASKQAQLCSTPALRPSRHTPACMAAAPCTTSQLRTHILCTHRASLVKAWMRKHEDWTSKRAPASRAGHSAWRAGSSAMLG